MYKILTIDGKDYKLEYSIEASLYSDCVENMSLMMSDLMNGRDARQAIKGVSNIPATTLTIFYAGLLEHHGPASEEKNVPFVANAKELAKKYLLSNDLTWYDLLRTCFEQMAEDGFFKLTGLEKLLVPEKTEEKPKVVPKDNQKSARASKSK